MKKNKMMRLASCLLVAVMLTTSVISGTFAKYVTTATDFDQARVAKWGVTVSVASKEAFAVNYLEANANTPTTATDGISVKSSNTEDVLAPGTKGTLATYEITGTPEVDVKIVTDQALTLTNWTVDGADYCPLVFTVGTKEIKMDDSNITTVAALKAAVEAEVAALATEEGKVIKAGTDLSTNQLTIGWEWPISVNDAKDTKLGDAATKATIHFTSTVTVEQVD